jgi:predicted ATPase
MGYDVFLSHSSHDHAVAEAVCAALESGDGGGGGLHCWIAPRDIVPGADWSESIVAALHECPILVIVLSEHAGASVQVVREVQRACERGARVIPFRIDGVVPSGALEYYLGPVQWLDAPAAEVEAHLPVLVETVRRMRAECVGGASPPGSALADIALRPGPASSSPAPTLVKPRTNLPPQLTSFVGRDGERAAVRERLATFRAVTLTGAGGTGKTRLSQEVAADVLGEFPDGVWLAELAPVSEPGQVAHAVAASLGREAPDDPSDSSPEKAITEHLRARRTLLLWDNCEQVAAACADLAAALLRACPGVRLLATSQHRLGLPGESVYPVPPLALPPDGDTETPPTPESLAGFESVRLFVERAQAVAPSFTLTDANAAAVAAICRRLDGVPLAIELAAARARAMPAEKIAERLDDRFRLLTGGSRLLPERQQALRAAMDWSHSLLSETERAVLRRLSVFAGGWTLDAAETVSGAGEVEAWEVADCLAWLVDKSLVLFEEGDGQRPARYRLLETVRQYAAERLAEAGEEDDCRRRHFAFFLDYAERVEAGRDGDAQNLAAAMGRMEAEHDNLRAALRWCRGRGDVDAEFRFVDALHTYWGARGLFGELREHVTALLEHKDALADEGRRAKVLGQAAHLAQYQGDFPAAVAYAREIVEIRRRAGDRDGEAGALLHLGMVLRIAGRFAEARPCVERALAIHSEEGNDGGAYYALQWLGGIASNERDYAAARAHLEESAAGWRRLGDQPWLLAWVLLPLATVACRLGDHAAAEAHLREAVEVFRQVGDRTGLVYVLERFAGLEAARGRPERSATLFGAAERLRQVLNRPLAPGDRQDFYDEDHAAAQDALGEVAFAAAEGEGRRLSLEEAVAYALGDGSG